MNDSLRSASYRNDIDTMNTRSALEETSQIDNLLEHIHARTFGRLHELNVGHGLDGRLHISAVAHSRFVGQLAEWAVLERVAPSDVDLDISLRLSSPHFREVSP